MPIGQSAYDFRLVIDGVTYGLRLAEDANGVRQWNDGLTPIVTPQFRSAAFGYDHVPPEIEVASVAEDWTGGAGYATTELGNATMTHRYNYSRGLDLSSEDRICISPKRQALLESDGTAIAAAPTGFLYSPTNGLYMRAGAYIYQFNAAAWVQRDDASGTFAGVAYTDLAELDGVLYGARGTTADYKTSPTGTTWTAFTDADENADFFAIRGNASDISSIWKVNVNIIKATTDGVNGGVAWAGGDEMGHTAETMAGMVTVDNNIFAFKREGIFLYTGTATQDIWKTLDTYATNGKQPFVWSNKLCYVPYGRRLLEFDPGESTNITLRPVFPLAAMDSLELKGDITAVGGDLYWLYIAVKTTAGNTYLLKGRPDKGWHTFMYLGANDCNALIVVPPATTNVPSTTNPCLVFGYGTAAHYAILARQGVPPDDDLVYQFDTTEGSVYGPYTNYGAKTYRKLLNHGMLLGTGISAGRYATLKYELDRSGTETTFISATGSSLTEANTSSEVAFNQLRYVLYMATGDISAGPSVDSIVLWSTLNPQRKRMWRPSVILDDDLALRGGVTGRLQPSALKLREVLFKATNKRITLKDREGYSYAVRLLDIASVGTVSRTIGGKRYSAKGYQLTLVELAAISTNLTTGIYGQSTYSGGHVYS